MKSPKRYKKSEAIVGFHDKKPASTATARISSAASKHIFDRAGKASLVKRSLTSWTIMLLLLGVALVFQFAQLGRLYTSEGQGQGGTYIEGYVGPVSNLNPIFARTPAEVAAGELLFARLYSRDENAALKPDLASSLKSSDGGKLFTLALKPDLTWTDGEKIDADDLVFTLRHIKHPDAQSKFKSSWDNIEVSKIDDLTLQFKLANPYVDFVELLELPLLPEHALAGVPSAEIRQSEFNRAPNVTSGSFRLRDSKLVDGQKYRLVLRPSELSWQQRPLVSRYVIDSFIHADTRSEAFSEKKLTAIAPDFEPQINFGDADPDTFQDVVYPSTSTAFLFFNNDDESLKSADLRRSLTQLVNVGEVNQAATWAYQSNGPLSFYSRHPDQSSQLKLDVASAAKRLDSNDDMQKVDGFWRQKGSETPITLRISVGEIESLRAAAKVIAQNWSEAGFQVEIDETSSADLAANRLPGRNYQILLHPIDLGVNDDVFSYWHSSQSRLQGYNFSSYSSETADGYLSDAATLTDQDLVDAKLAEFMKVWRSDAPAVALGGLYIHSWQLNGTPSQDLILLDQPKDLLGQSDGLSLRSSLNITVEQ